MELGFREIGRAVGVLTPKADPGRAGPRGPLEVPPCFVVFPGEASGALRTAIVAPMATGSRPAGFRVALTFQGKQGLIVLDQIRTLDRARLVRRLGSLRPTTLAATLQVLQAMFAT